MVVVGAAHAPTHTPTQTQTQQPTQKKVLDWRWIPKRKKRRKKKKNNKNSLLCIMTCWTFFSNLPDNFNRISERENPFQLFFKK